MTRVPPNLGVFRYAIKARVREPDGRWSPWRALRYRDTETDALRVAEEERVQKREDGRARDVSVWHRGKRIDYTGVGGRQRGIQAFHGSGLWTDLGTAEARRYGCAVCGQIIATFPRDALGTVALGDASKGKAAVLAHVRARHPDKLKEIA